MSSRPNNTTPEAKFRAAVEAKLAELLRPRPFIIPTLAADPPETDPTNLWMRYDGRLRGRYWNGATYTYVDYPMRSDITAPPAVPAYPAAPAVGSVPTTYQTTWTGTWSQTYQGSNAKRTDALGEANLVYGASGQDAFGQQKALVGFDGPGMVAALTGSTIQRIELTMTNLKAYWGTVAVFFGMHNLSAEPATFDPGGITLRRSATATFGVGIQKISLPMAFAQALRAGTAKGLAIEAPTSEVDFYGYAAGVGSGYTPPQLTITYAK